MHANTIEYTVTDLGTLGGPESSANAISQNGIVVGNATPNSTTNHPFEYQGNGPMQDLGLLNTVNGVVGVATSVNSKGEVAGWSDAPGASRPTHAFLYTSGTGLIDLGTLGGVGSEALGINESGNVAGAFLTTSGVSHGAMWTYSGGTVAAIDLGPQFVPTCINNTGLMGGILPIANGNPLAEVYNISTGSLTVIPTLSGGTWNQVNAINESGLVVGISDAELAGTEATRAFLYNVNNGVLTDLGNPVLAGWSSSAGGVNDLGALVGGYQVNASGSTEGFIYTQAGGMQGLNSLVDPSLGWNIWAANSINDAGVIVGQGVTPQGYLRAVMLTPVPESSAIQLILAALAISAGLLAARRCRANRWIGILIRIRNRYLLRTSICKGTFTWSRTVTIDHSGDVRSISSVAAQTAVLPERSCFPGTAISTVAPPIVSRAQSSSLSGGPRAAAVQQRPRGWASGGSAWSSWGWPASANACWRWRPSSHGRSWLR
jgi:probable HAF family extracellular repeat protein